MQIKIVGCCNCIIKDEISNGLIKPKKWRVSCCIFLFITTTDFWRRLEPSHRTILGSVLAKCSYFLKACCNYVSFYLYIKKRKMNVTFTQEFFAFTNSG